MLTILCFPFPQELTFISTMADNEELVDYDEEEVRRDYQNSRFAKKNREALVIISFAC